MKALKSELARKLLADKAAAEQLRTAVEFIVSSNSRKSGRQIPEVTYTDESGNQKKFCLEVVPYGVSPC